MLTDPTTQGKDRQLIFAVNKSDRSARVLCIIELVSSFLIILPVIHIWVPFEGLVQIFFGINSNFFYVFLFGLNLDIFFLKKRRISFSVFLTTILGLGSSIALLTGYIFTLTQVPYYSDFIGVFLGTSNILLAHINLHEKNWIEVTFESFDKLLLVFLSIFLVVRLLMIRPDFMYLDDQNNAYSIGNFLASMPNLSAPVYSSYFGRTLDLEYPLGFPIWIGLVLKGAGISSVYSNIFIPKVFMIIANSFIIFPVYLCLTRFVKNKSIISIFIVIICFNQWIFIESPFLLIDITYLFYFASSVYFFLLFLTEKESVEHNVILGIVFGSIAGFIRPNGFIQMIVVLLVFFSIWLAKWMKEKRPGASSRFNLMHRLDLSIYNQLGKWGFLQAVFFFLFFAIPQITYIMRNDITMFHFISKYQDYGYFGPGNNGQFTPVDSISFSWLFERLRINLPFYIFNFTQMTGFIPDAFGIPVAKIMVNVIISLFLFFFGTASNIYYWLKYLKKQPILVLFHLSLLIGNFAPIILWGETYSVLLRLSQPFCILFFPPMILLLKDIQDAIQCRTHYRVHRLLNSRIIFTFICITVLIGSFTFFPFLFDQGGITFTTFIFQQFYTPMPPFVPPFIPH